jgi:Tol biopolymer transport system component
MVFMKRTSTGPPAPDDIYEVALANLDGSESRQVTSDGMFKFLPHLSPDGTKVIYTKYAVGVYGSPDGKPDVALYDFATGRERMLTAGGNSLQPTWSPDGKQIAYLGSAGTSGSTVQAATLWVVNTDGSHVHKVASATGAPDDGNWGDIAWSSDGWIMFVVGQLVEGCFTARIDKIRPDGSGRTKVSDGGSDCTPQGADAQTGDADPGWSADGKTIYSSRGVRTATGMYGRHLFAFSSDAWVPDKPMSDLQASEPSCGCLTPKGSPDAKRVLLVRGCPDSRPKGIYVTDTAGSTWTFVAEGSGPDWNPAAAAR